MKKDNESLVSSKDKISTKQKIMVCAANLFAEKGYTETTIRELALAVGMKSASLYNHFPSKNAILEYILEDFFTQNDGAELNKDIPFILWENPTPDGILSCLHLTFPEGWRDYYLKILCVLMQEQHRNPLVRSFISEHFIPNTERKVKTIIKVLKEQNIIRKDTDPDFWMKTCSSLTYTFSNRMMLGIGDSSPGFEGMRMVGLLRNVFELMLETCGIIDSKL